ncbi:MAG TPA: glycosyltransferase family 2 protein [Lachnospiraceae bacterium]|jgi:dolichol-phosphate mannosyltransferase|nr:glycosyltransferase family 2 protein [Lachnospiraceae bacterium]
MDNLYIIIPAYNEEATIKQVIDDWYPVVEQIGNDSKLVIINDGSKDRTYEIMQEYAKTRPFFLPLTKENGGHGATVLFGYHYAISQNADYIFQTDSDGQTLPSEFAEFWALREQYDMIIGHRCKREDGISRIFVTKVLKFVLRICFGVSVTDANTPFRLLKRDTLVQYIDLIPKDFNLSNVILSVIYTKKNLRIKYLPITFRPRQGGVNSINLPKIFGIGKQALKDFRAINRSLKQ